jgi:hypothetical protein
MIDPILIALIVLGLPTLYFAWRSREFRKFLAGAFFVSAGIQFYLYLANVSMPLLGTNLVLTPEISEVRPSFISSCSGFAFTLVLSKSQKPQASDAVMLSEAKHLWFISVGVSAQKDPRFFASLRMTL